MNVLITNIELTVPGGTVSYVFDLAQGLQKRGFTVELYTYKCGFIGDTLKNYGINVATRLSELKNTPDIIHSHHNPLTVDILRRFKNTPVVFFLHDRTNFHDHPPKHSHILKHVAVDYNCLERLIEQGIEEKNTTVIYNWVDTGKFKLRVHFNEKPSNALVFSNYATKNNYYTVIEQACKVAGLKLDAVGKGMGTALTNPQDVLLQYDLTFAKAKAAIEALSTGSCVILCDYAGLGEMVNTSNFAHYRKYNFGRKLLTRPATVELIVEEIAKFKRSENQSNALTIREEASFEKMLDQIIHLYHQIINDFARGKRGMSSNLYATYILSRFIKAYFLFSFTRFFKLLSKFKKYIKNRIYR